MDKTQKSAHFGRAYALLAADVIYLALVAATFIFGINLETDAVMQYALHFVLIAAAVAYVLFIEAVYHSVGADAKPLLFAAMFAVPVIMGRGIGIYAISAPLPDIWNFYGAVSVSRTIEVLSWTTLFPLSVLFLAKLFLGIGKKLPGALCIASAACCFAAFASIISPEPVFMMIGVMGWGVLFLAIIIAYIADAARARSKRQ